MFEFFVCFDIELYEWFVYFGYRSLVSCLFANIFPHSAGCLFVLIMVSFPVQYLFSLIGSHLFSFAFLSFALGDRARKIVRIYVRGCFACALCWEFCGSCLTVVGSWLVPQTKNMELILLSTCL